MSLAASHTDLPAEPFGQTGVRQYAGRIMAWLCLTIGLCAAAMGHRSGRFTDDVSWSGRGQKLVVVSTAGQVFFGAASRRGATAEGSGWQFGQEFGRRKWLAGARWGSGLGGLLGLEAKSGPPPVLNLRGGPDYDSGLSVRAQWTSVAALFLLWPLVYGARKVFRAVRRRAD